MNLFKLFTRRNKQTRQRITLEYNKKTGTITALRLNDKKGRTTTTITRRATLERLNSSNLAPAIRKMEKGGTPDQWFRYTLAATIGGGRVVDTHNYLFKYIDTHTKGEGLANHVYLIASLNARPYSTKKCLSFKLDSDLIARNGYDIIRDLYMQDVLSLEDFTVTFNIEDTEKFDEKTLAEIAWETFAKRFHFDPAEGDPYKAL